MKRCPTCHRVETDEALKFCRVDGATLLSNSPAIAGESGTAELSSALDASEDHTSILPHTDPNINRATASTTVLPQTQAPSTTSGLTRPPHPNKAVLIIGALL